MKHTNFVLILLFLFDSSLSLAGSSSTVGSGNGFGASGTGVSTEQSTSNKKESSQKKITKDKKIGDVVATLDESPLTKEFYLYEVVELGLQTTLMKKSNTEFLNTFSILVEFLTRKTAPKGAIRIGESPAPFLTTNERKAEFIQEHLEEAVSNILSQFPWIRELKTPSDNETEDLLEELVAQYGEKVKVYPGKFNKDISLNLNKTQPKKEKTTEKTVVSKVVENKIEVKNIDISQIPESSRFGKVEMNIPLIKLNNGKEMAIVANRDGNIFFIDPVSGNDIFQPTSFEDTFYYQPLQSSKDIYYYNLNQHPYHYKYPHNSSKFGTSQIIFTTLKTGKEVAIMRVNNYYRGNYSSSNFITLDLSSGKIISNSTLFTNLKYNLEKPIHQLNNGKTIFPFFSDGHFNIIEIDTGKHYEPRYRLDNGHFEVTRLKNGMDIAIITSNSGSIHYIDLTTRKEYFPAMELGFYEKKLLPPTLVQLDSGDEIAIILAAGGTRIIFVDLNNNFFYKQPIDLQIIDNYSEITKPAIVTRLKNGKQVAIVYSKSYNHKIFYFIDLATGKKYRNNLVIKHWGANHDLELITLENGKTIFRFSAPKNLYYDNFVLDIDPETGQPYIP